MARQIEALTARIKYAESLALCIGMVTQDSRFIGLVANAKVSSDTVDDLRRAIDCAMDGTHE